MTSSSTPELTERPWRPVPGPADREAFFAAQARNRRTTWRLTALCLMGVALMGIPISAVLTPLLLAALFLMADLINLVLPLSDWLSLIQISDRQPGVGGMSDAMAAVVMTILLVGPGALAVGLAWLGTGALFRRAGPEALVHVLGGRPPRAGDLEEHQLGNVVEEMAIAAGVRPPKVMLLDGPVVNAAALGSSHEDAVVLVSRRLLDELDRDETQAVVAHLIGAIGNGDLRVALSMLSLVRTIALLMTGLGATLGPAARRTLVRVIRLGLRRPGTGSHDDAVAGVDELLQKSMNMNDGDLDQLSSKKTTVLDVVRAPLLMAHFAIWMCRLAFVSFVVAPLLALVWRTRRYLADATAVQLTRNPDGLARALASLSAKGGIVPDAGWAVPLFIVGPRSGRSGPVGPAAAKSGILGDDFGLLSFDPPMRRRMSRLRRQGASVDLAFVPYRLSAASVGCITLMVVPLGAVLVGCALTVTGIALVMDMLLLTPMLAVVHLLLRWLAG
jgi:Zn-dependent protease with chaperone function